MNKYFKKLISYEEHWKILEQCDAMANLVEKNLRIQLWTTQKPAYLIKFNPPFYIGLIFHYYFYWWHFWIFTRSIGGFERPAMRRLNWIITQLKIFMAAHHITKEPLSYLSSPHPPALLGPPYLFLRSIDHSVENCPKKVLIISE